MQTPQLLSTALLLCISGLWAEDTLRQSSVFIEAEDFTPIGEGWAPGQGWNDDIYEPTSGDAVLGHPGFGTGTATKETAIPAEGTYKVWVRYLKIGAYPGTFGVRIEQGGATVFDQEYRTNPQGSDWRPVWESGEAHLAAGPATVTLYLAQPGIRQRVDCLLITPDLEYQPDFHDFAPRTFLRFRLDAPAEAVNVSVTTYRHRGPIYYADAGIFTTAGLGVPGDPIPAGQWSPWGEITKHLDRGRWLATVKLRFSADGKPLGFVRGEFQVATEPDEAGALSFPENIEGEIVALSLPGDLARFRDQAKLVSQISAGNLATARALGLPPLSEPEGQIPLEMMVCGWGDSYRSRAVLGDEVQVTRILGANSLNDVYGVRGEVARAAGYRRGFLQYWLPYQAWACPTRADMATLMDEHFARGAAELLAEDPEALWTAYRNKLWDEPGTSDLGHMAGCESCCAAFRTYLQEQGLSPQDLGKASWDQVRLIPRDQATDLPSRKLHYWSIQFRDLTNALLVREARLACERHFGQGILTSVNFTDAPQSGWESAMVHGPDWFLYGRLKATTMIWSEDWTALGPEVCGYIADTMRAAARPHDLALGEYIICNHLPTLEQRAFSALMHGVRILHFYCYGPYYAFADGMIADNPEAQRVVGTTLRKINRADRYLAPAKVPLGQVALLWGKSHEIWQEDAAVGTERRTVYLAMQHAHVPVDIVCEEDIAGGILAGYRVLYVTESNVSRAAASQIVQWVKGGGVLQMCAGAGMKDELDEPLADLLELCGVTVESVEKPGGDYREHYGIPHQVPAGELVLPAGALWEACTVPLLGYRERATPAGAEVLARFSDGSPAILKHTVGSGAVLRFCFMPGLGYVKSAKPGPNRLTLDYQPAQLSLLTAALRLAKVTSPLIVSEPLVEAQLLKGPEADVVVLANWTGRELPAVEVTVTEGAAVRSVERLGDGPLTFTRDGEAIGFTTPVGNTEVLVLRR